MGGRLINGNEEVNITYNPMDWYWLVNGEKYYSSASASYVDKGDDGLSDWIKSGNLVTNIASENELIGVLRAANIPPYHLVPSRLIVDRLQAAGKLEAAQAALDAADIYTRQRWNTRTAIYADDPTAVALLKAIGADPVEILAPE